MDTFSRICFLTYLSRSGSTLLSGLLDNFNDVCVTTEGELPLELFGVKSYSPIQFNSGKEIEKYLNILENTTKLVTWRIDFDTILKLCKNYSFPITGVKFVKLLLTDYLRAHNPNAKYVIYKASPLMPWHIKEAQSHFPNARYIHLIRDPRAVYNSQKSSINPYTKKRYSDSPILSAIEWKKAIESCGSQTNPNVFIIKYEDLLQETDKTLYRIIDYLGVSNRLKKSGISLFAERIPDVEKELHNMITQTQDKNKIFVWKTSLSEKEKMYIDILLGDLLDIENYERVYSGSDLKWYLEIIFIIEKGYIVFNIFLRRLRRLIAGIFTYPLYSLTKIKLKIFSSRG